MKHPGVCHMRTAKSGRAARTGRRVHDGGVMAQCGRLLDRSQLALLVEERAHVLRQFGREKLDRYRLRVRTMHLVGRRDFRRFGVHDSLLGVIYIRLLAIAPAAFLAGGAKTDNVFLVYALSDRRCFSLNGKRGLSIPRMIVRAAVGKFRCRLISSTLVLAKTTQRTKLPT
ncbi:hypothetical protein BURKHO8Y_150023 [Burkholderia sp. 8Y]|nr:hypothetical protein BURKHO8Y_150023 [Burkholderia sp. 8Y]